MTRVERVSADQTYLTTSTYHSPDGRGCHAPDLPLADPRGSGGIECSKSNTLIDDPVFQSLRSMATNLTAEVATLQANVKMLSDANDALTKRLEQLELTQRSAKGPSVPTKGIQP